MAKARLRRYPLLAVGSSTFLFRPTPFAAAPSPAACFFFRVGEPRLPAMKNRPSLMSAPSSKLACFSASCHCASRRTRSALGFAAPLYAAWFLLRAAPRQDLTVRELPQFAALRVGARLVAAALAVGAGEAEMTR